MLERDPLFRELSPEPGELDEAAVVAALRRDPDSTLATLAAMGASSDRALRTLAQRLAGQVVLDLARGDHRPSRGIRSMARVPIRHGGDLDLEASLDPIVEAHGAGAIPDAEALVSRTWVRRDHALTLIVDRSGSMGGDRLVAAALAAAVMAWRAPSDHSVVAFAGDAIVIKAQGDDRAPEAVVGDVLALHGYGTTDLALGLRAGLSQLQQSRSSKRVAVLLSDGETTAGSDPLAVARRFDALHVVTPPDGVEAARRLASAGGGRWAVLDRPTAVPATLLALMR